MFGPFRRIMLGSLLVLGALATLMIWGLSRRLHRAADERQRLLQAAIDASEAERRRIARDLHDGVVQDLAGTAFALSAAAREPGPVERAAVGRRGRRRCAARCARCGRCWSRSTRPTSTPTGWRRRWTTWSPRPRRPG